MRINEIIIENQMFAKFKNNADIEWIPTKELVAMAAEKPTQMSDDEYNALWADLNANGMNTPLIVTVGTETDKMRLDSGNHRVRLFAKHGIDKVPCKVEIVKNQVKRTGNGMHSGIGIK